MRCCDGDDMDWGGVMRRQKRCRPYVRKANGRERAGDLRTAYRLAFYQSLGKPFYVLVQHGFPNEAIGVGASKRQLQLSVFLVRAGNMRFRQWAKLIS